MRRLSAQQLVDQIVGFPRQSILGPLDVMVENVLEDGLGRLIHEGWIASKELEQTHAQ